MSYLQSTLVLIFYNIMVKDKARHIIFFSFRDCLLTITTWSLKFIVNPITIIIFLVQIDLDSLSFDYKETSILELLGNSLCKQQKMELQMVEGQVITRLLVLRRKSSTSLTSLTIKCRAKTWYQPHKYIWISSVIFPPLPTSHGVFFKSWRKVSISKYHYDPLIKQILQYRA